MTEYGFSAFLKLISLSPKAQRTEVRKRLLPSDSVYDFHKSLRRLAKRRLIGGEPIDEILRVASQITNPAERASALAGLQRLELWRSTSPGPLSIYEAATYRSPRQMMSFNFRPDFGQRLGELGTAIHLWNTKKPPLDPRMAYAALALVAEQYGAKVGRPEDLAVLSLRDGQMYRLSDVSSHLVLGQRIIATLEDVFLDVIRELGSPPAGTEDRPPPG